MYFQYLYAWSCKQFSPLNLASNVTHGHRPVDCTIVIQICHLHQINYVSCRFHVGFISLLNDLNLLRIQSCLSVYFSSFPVRICAGRWPRCCPAPWLKVTSVHPPADAQALHNQACQLAWFRCIRALRSAVLIEIWCFVRLRACVFMRVYVCATHHLFPMVAAANKRLTEKLAAS